ncbi:eukaryotic translation initiation factor 3 subunit [Thraustotheca clavata]|uniref:Eukaryotic translation initiation factor 3 subunit n=1 Tax=Thraustotheca clavata TaxID=74557 RepID=A0A1W0A9H0_9STRA|nr:eukaryotic translation initiation factor 3 subunit [Thraustotheca clavata]
MGEAMGENKTVDVPQVEETMSVSVAVQGPAGKNSVMLEYVSPLDTVMSLRQMLAEFPVFAHHTCYHLELQNPDGQWVPLNDFIEFGEYTAVFDDVETKKEYAVRMVLDRYDVRKVRAQVRRFRDILSNPPIPQSAQAPKPKKTIEEKKLTPKQETDKQLKLLKDIHTKLEGLAVPVTPSLATLYAPIALQVTKPEKKDAAAPKKSKGKKKAAVVEEKNNNEEAPIDTTLPKCVESIIVSGFNPPPGPRKLAGDLTYLEVTLTDGSVHQITAHVAGFYINKSTKTKFNPAPAGAHHHQFVDVLLAASTTFAGLYEKLLSTAASWAAAGASSVEAMVQASNNANQSLVWATPVSNGTHNFDANRAQDDLSIGIDERGVIRDWNEEYQCARELPNGTLREQIVRSRVLYKIMTEFVEAATQGAVAIVDGTIPAINPMDDESAFVYVYNHIFFSRAVEGQKHGATESDESHENAYSSANHDLQGVKAYNAADVTGLHTLATVVIDYLGVRIIGQSIIPGILQGEAASKLVYGSVDGGKTIASNPAMHAMMQQASETLLIADRSLKPLGFTGDEQAPPASGEATTEVVSLCGPVEAKGILGADNRHYILDLVRITPKDWSYYNPESTTITEKSRATLLAEADTGKYTALLRPELVQLFARWKANQEKAKLNKAKEGEDKTKDEVAEKADEAKEEEEEELATLRYNTNVFMNYPACTDAAVATEDETVAKDAANYLQTMVIPAFVADLRRGAMYPVDGTALTDMFHACGINMRYLGKVASLLASYEPHVSKYIAEVFEIEMIARSLKHIVAQLFLEHPALRTMPGSFLLQVLNALLGEPIYKSSTEVAEVAQSLEKLSLEPAAVADLSASALWARVNKDVNVRFGYTLRFWPVAKPSKAKKGAEKEPVRAHKVSLLRRVCQRLGWQVASLEYDFEAEAPFTAGDVTGILPVVKSSLPAHPFIQAATLIERGRYLLSQGVLAPAYEMLQDASSLLYQVCGGAHEDAALVCASTATALYHAGDIPGAIASQRRALGLYTQLKGVDYYDTAFAHANLSLYLHANAETAQAVAHLQRAIHILELGAGPHYPETSVLYYKLGMMCQDVGHVALALLCHREALRRGELDRMQAASCLHAMAMACVLVGGFREALAYEQKVLSLYTEVFNDEDPRVVECKKYIDTFTERAVAGAKDREVIDAAAAADAMANALVEEWEVEIRQEEKQKQKKNGKKKGAKK